MVAPDVSLTARTFPVSWDPSDLMASVLLEQCASNNKVVIMQTFRNLLPLLLQSPGRCFPITCPSSFSRAHFDNHIVHHYHNDGWRRRLSNCIQILIKGFPVHCIGNLDWYVILFYHSLQMSTPFNSPFLNKFSSVFGGVLNRSWEEWFSHRIQEQDDGHHEPS